MMERMMQRVLKFVNDRDWAQFHNPKDLAVSLTLEAAEVLEHFQWKDPKEMKQHLKNNKQAVADELIDVLYWILLMAHDFDIDLDKAFDSKMKQNEKKYPVDKARGKHSKYTAYQNG
jgi:NTP pyrophosphatase (non-canonical NTP hydrolase)